MTARLHLTTTTTRVALISTGIGSTLLSGAENNIINYELISYSVISVLVYRTVKCPARRHRGLQGSNTVGIKTVYFKHVTLIVSAVK